MAELGDAHCSNRPIMTASMEGGGSENLRSCAREVVAPADEEEMPAPRPRLSRRWESGSSMTSSSSSDSSDSERDGEEERSSAMRWRALSRYDVFHTTSSALVV